MKINHGEAIITPEIGIRLAGYGLNSYSVAKRDDLIVSALVMDDGNKKSAILGYDLIGLAPDYISRIREGGIAQRGFPVVDVFVNNLGALLLRCLHIGNELTHRAFHYHQVVLAHLLFECIQGQGCKVHVAGAGDGNVVFCLFLYLIV